MDAIEVLIERSSERTPGCCATRFPILLLHGLGYRDDVPLLDSWGRIPDQLSRAGAKVFLGGLDAWAAQENNAIRLKTRVEAILGDTGAGKVNIIAHSKGGLEARLMISRLGMAGAVASLTTVCTPHRGTSAADFPETLPTHAAGFTFKVLDRFSGDQSPSSGTAMHELSRPFMETFNGRTPDVPGVYYQSLGALVRDPADDPFFLISSAIVRKHEGENDGIVSVHSCPWGCFRGLIRGKNPSRGLSHRDMVDFQKCSISGIDIPGVYVALVKELKQLGY